MPAQSKLTVEFVNQVASRGLERFLATTHTLVALLDPGGRLLAWNPALETLITEPRVADSIGAYMLPDPQASLQALLYTAQQHGSDAQGLLDFGAEGRPVNFECLVISLQTGGFLLFAEPVAPPLGPGSADHQLHAELQATKLALAHKSTELQAVLAQVDEVAHTDSLTFLPNRRSILADLQREVLYSERYGTPLTISMLDLDNYKIVNDTYGHTTGDQVLGRVAHDLRAHIRHPDEIGRYGGDEFLVVLPNSTSTAAIEQANRLCRQIRSTPLALGHDNIHITLSVGIAQLKVRKESWHELLQRADRALYIAKGAGGDHWVISEE